MKIFISRLSFLFLEGLYWIRDKLFLRRSLKILFAKIFINLLTMWWIRMFCFPFNILNNISLSDKDEALTLKVLIYFFRLFFVKTYKKKRWKLIRFSYAPSRWIYFWKKRSWIVFCSKKLKGLFEQGRILQADKLLIKQILKRS